jgi:hypothetical protein
MSDLFLCGMKVFAYPNPATDVLTAGISNNNYQNVSFMITDISGRSLAQYVNPTISGSDVQQIVDVSAYAEGLYIVTIIADNQNYSFKFAKK